MIATSILQEMAARAWALVHVQHGVVARWQLLEIGYSPAAIRHRLEIGRLHEIHRGVYAVGRAELSRKGRWMAAVLAGGHGALLSHQSQAEYLGFRPYLGLPIEITVPTHCRRTRKGVVIHRADIASAQVIERDGIPGVSVVVAMVQIAERLSLGELERAINAADGLDLIASSRARRPRKDAWDPPASSRPRPPHLRHEPL